jgi:hypothetical protein
MYMKTFAIWLSSEVSDCKIRCILYNISSSRA